MREESGAIRKKADWDEGRFAEAETNESIYAKNIIADLKPVLNRVNTEKTEEIKPVKW